MQNSLEESRRLFAAGSSDDAAETSLEGLNRSAKESGKGQLQIATNLLRVAFACKESNDEKTAQRVAKRALAHLDKAEHELQGDDKALAGINKIRGVIFERLLGTTDEAAQSYREALKHQPGDESAKAKLRQVGGDADQGAIDTK